jgi:hypothetical protein
MNFIKKNWQKLTVFVFIFLMPIVSFAKIIIDPTPVSPSSGSSGKIVNPLGVTKTVPDLIRTILEIGLRVGIPVVALAIVYSGFLFVFARGNTEKLGKAKDTLLYSIIGAAILLGAWSIAKLISATVLAL